MLRPLTLSDNEAGAQKARYVHGPRIDEIVVMTNAHGTFYPQHDALGSVTMLTDAQGKVTERYSYSVTGETTITDSSGAVLSPPPLVTAGCSLAASGWPKSASTTTATVSTPPS